MRSIEDLAREEDARLWEERGAHFKGFLWFIGLALAPWGWILFARGNMGQGAVLILGSILALLLAGGILRNARFSIPALLIGSGVFIASGVLYFLSRMPTFFWGKDPSFWSAVQDGAVVEPFWSPLSYLEGQAAVFLSHGQMEILPLVSALQMALALGFWAYEAFLRSPNQTSRIWTLTLFSGFVLAVSMPFWNLATLASGLPPAQGFLLLLLLRSCAERDEKPWLALHLLTGLLFAVHPLWGLLGFLVFWARRERTRTPGWQRGLCTLAGISPYLWVILRADRFFPSWGGRHPFEVALTQWRSLWDLHWSQDGPSDDFLLVRIGWAGGVLVAGGFLSLLASQLSTKRDRRSTDSSLGFWIWIFSGAGGLLFASRSTETLGPTFVWFLTEGCSLFILGLDKTMGLLTRRPGPSWKAVLGGLVLFSALLGSGLWQGREFWRRDLYFPAQHAENLLRVLGPRSLLVCGDPFQHWACVATRGDLGSRSHSVILNKDYLAQKWFAAETIDKEPEVLFSEATGRGEGDLGRFVKDNRDQWHVFLDQPFPMEKNSGLKSEPMGLARLFTGSGPGDPGPEDVPIRFDLVGLPAMEEARDPATRHYLESYVEGFNQLGLGFMDRSRYSEAIRSFDRALKLDPGFKEAQDHLSYLYSQKNILEAAQLDFERTLKDHPAKIAELMRDLTESKTAGREAETVGLLDRIIHLNAELANSQYQLSRIYDKEGRTNEARALLEASVALNPKQLESQLSLGRLMKKMGDKLRAREAFHEALVLDPLNKEAQLEYWKSLNER